MEEEARKLTGTKDGKTTCTEQRPLILKLDRIFDPAFLFLASKPDYAAAAKLLQSCPTLCNPIDGSPPGSSVHGSFQARVLEWVAIDVSET